MLGFIHFFSSLLIAILSLLGIESYTPQHAAPLNIAAAPTEATTTTITTKPATSTPDAVAPLKKIAVVKEKRGATPFPAPVTVQSSLVKRVPAETPAVDSNKMTRAALVNILCITKSNGTFSPITGSGIIIDPRGIILTNAHIAQYLLLKDHLTPNFIQCVARQGSPAKTGYTVELMYVSPRWVENNFKGIAQDRPMGTGEDDFALLRITGSATSDPAPMEYPSLPLAASLTDSISKSPVLIAGYPAGFLGGEAIAKDLYAVSTVTTIKEIFTFKENTADLISVGGTIASQRGASGGAVVSLTNGALIGMIATASDSGQTADRDLRAITIEHINRSIISQTGQSLENYLRGDLAFKSQEFARDIAPRLITLLESVL